MNPQQYMKGGAGMEPGADRMTTAIVYKEVVLDVFAHITEHFVDELGEEDGLAAVRKLKELWVKKVQLSGVCQPLPSRPTPVFMPNYYAPPLQPQGTMRMGVTGQGWIPTRVSSQPLPVHQPVVASRHQAINAHSRLQPAFPARVGQRLIATHVPSGAAHGGAVEEAGDNRVDDAGPSAVSEEVPPPPVLQYPHRAPIVAIVDDSAIPPPPAKRIRILRPRAKLPTVTSRPPLPQLDGALSIKWHGVGMDDPSSSSDDGDDPFAGWDEFTAECDPSFPNSTGQGEKGEDLDELTSADDDIVREQGEDEAQRECTALGEKFADTMLGKVTQRNGVWKINFSEAILRIKGRELLYRECEGSAKF